MAKQEPSIYSRSSVLIKWFPQCPWRNSYVRVCQRSRINYKNLAV